MSPNIFFWSRTFGTDNVAIATLEQGLIWAVVSALV